MKFKIIKKMYQDKPSPRAFIDERTTDDPVKVRTFKGTTDWWYKEGCNHRVENNHIKRDFKIKSWFINIESIEDLIKLSIENKGLNISPSYNNPSIMEITLEE